MTQDKNSAAAQTKASQGRKRIKVYGADRPLYPMSQSLVGVFILALGLAAIIAVGYLAFVRFYPTTPRSAEPMALDAQLAAKDQAAAPTQPTDKDISTLKLDKADKRDMTGQWYARNAGRSAYLTIMEDGRYQIVVFMDADGVERRISTGILEYDEEEGVATLKSSYDLLPKIEGVVVKSLTQRMFKVVPLRETRTGAQYWVAHGKNSPRTAVHPLFNHLGRADSFIVWSRLKENR